jgi:hypothetical protein
VVEVRKTLEIQFDKNVKALLAAGRTHEQLTRRIRQLVLAEAEELPPRKVIYCRSYGGFGLNERFETYLKSFTSVRCKDFRVDCVRDDSALLKAIVDFGRSICDELPYILEDFRTSNKWKLEELMRITPGWEKGFEQYPDLVVDAKAFCDRARSERSGSKDDNDEDFVDFAKRNPNRWMQHEGLVEFGGALEPFPTSLGFAHELLCNDPAKYRAGPDEQQDAAIYERVGLLAASPIQTKLAIEQVPALVNYEIEEYDGLENVKF